jgi:hypothetical protein
MVWYFYTNADESLQIFIGILLIIAIVFLLFANIYFFISEKIKNRIGNEAAKKEIDKKRNESKETC